MLSKITPLMSEKIKTDWMSKGIFRWDILETITESTFPKERKMKKNERGMKMVTMAICNRIKYFRRVSK